MYRRFLTNISPGIRGALMYTTGRGPLPLFASVRTPMGRIEVQIDSVDDLLTLGECFGKLDYRVAGDECLIIDAGANIGISALYFLSHAPNAHVVCIEPDPRNVERLRRNLTRNHLEHRVSVVPSAIGAHAGISRFLIEKTGRYGMLVEEGVAVDDADAVHSEILVDSVAAEQFLALQLAATGRIDILKLDVEGQELPILDALSTETLRGIEVIYAEIMTEPPALFGFTHSRQGTVSRFARRSEAVGGGER